MVAPGSEFILNTRFCSGALNSESPKLLPTIEDKTVYNRSPAIPWLKLLRLGSVFRLKLEQVSCCLKDWLLFMQLTIELENSSKVNEGRANERYDEVVNERRPIKEES